MADVLFGAFLLALCFYVGRTWFRWFRAEPRLVSPKWRSSVTVIGFSACTVSLVTILLLMLYATVSSSLTPYHPISVLANRTIFVTSLTPGTYGCDMARKWFACHRMERMITNRPRTLSDQSGAWLLLRWPESSRHGTGTLTFLASTCLDTMNTVQYYERRSA